MFYGHKVRRYPKRINREIFYKMRGYKSASWYIKQLKEETEKIKITDQDCFNRDEYRERLWEIKRCVDQIKKDRPIGKNEEMVGRKKQGRKEYE